MQNITPGCRALFLAGGVLLSSLAGSEAQAQEKPYGYTDTALLPGTTWHVHDPARPLPPVVTPGPFVPSPAPSDAVVLFDGTDLSRWAEVKDGSITNASFSVKQTGEIHTKQEFGDCQLHVEFAMPATPDGDWSIWGNSGVFLEGLYEIQIIQTDIYADGITGAIYGQTPPLARALRPAGEWQSYDIIFAAPRFDAGGNLTAPAYFTIFLNGVLIQNHTAALGPTRHRELATYDNKATRGPVMLQYHGSAVRFRNLWIRPF
jgi:hypothetical protein